MPSSPHRNTGRAAALKLATRAAHEALDGRLTAAEPFRDAARYGDFVRLQRRFFALVDPLYRDAALAGWFEALPALSRLDAADADLAAVGVVADRNPETLSVSAPQALGWLYVAEGSRLGAALLAIEAAKIGYGPRSGARHLAGDEGGRGRAWNAFRRQLDAAPLMPDEEKEVVAGALAAFAFMTQAADEVFGAPAAAAG